MSLNNAELLVEALLSEIQALEEAAIGVFEGMTLSLAAGVNLDVFGVIVGRARAGESDDDYRDILRAQIRTNLAGGTVEDILVVMTLVFGAALPLTLTEGSIAEFEVDVGAAITTSKATSMATAVGRGKAGGVKANLKYFESTPSFAYDGFGGAKYDGGFKYKSSIDSGSLV